MLYKYTKIDEYLSSILKDGYIFAASPEVLNDPCETKVCLTMEGVDVGNYLKYLSNKMKVENEISPEKILVEMDETVQMLRINSEQYLSDVEININNVLKSSRISSLSRNKNNPLMWALYADSHNGLCIEFESSYGLFSMAEPVIYTDIYPLVPMDWRIVGSDELWKRAVLTKANFWSYEEESRLVMRADENGQNIVDQLLLKNGESKTNRKDNKNGSLYYFGRDKIKSVFLGLRVNQEKKNEVCKLIEGSNIKLYQAKMCRGSYELSYCLV